MRESWQTKKLGELGKVITGSTPSTRDESNYSSPDVCFVKPSDIAKTGITTISNTEFHISRKAFQQSRKLPKGSVLTTCIGIIGKVGILGVDATCNQQINAIIPDKSVISSSFLAYSILSRQHLLSSIANAPVVPIINKGEFSSVLIPVPPFTEQEKIVAELDCLTGIIEKKKQQLEELDKLAQSIFYDMFGDPIANEKGWEVKKLGEVCSSMVRGPFGSALKKEFFVTPSNTTYKVYEQKHAIQKDAKIGAYYITEEKFKELSRFEVKPGDIIMSCSGTIGELYAIPAEAEKGIINQALLKFSLNNKIVEPFFLFMMYYLRNTFETKGSGISNIGSVKFIKNTGIALPSLDLQNEFAEKIEAIEKQKELVKRSIVETETLFKSRMDYWFN